MIGKVFRPDPAAPTQAMQSFHILAPLGTHFRKATCAEVGCSDYERGWRLPTATLGEDDLALFRQLGYRFTQLDGEDGAQLYFDPEQPCFRSSEHKIRLDREEVYLTRPGDWRVPLSRVERELGSAPVVFSGADAWADAVHTHLEKFDG